MNSEKLHLCVHSETLLLSSLLISVIYFKDHIEHVICFGGHGPKKSNSNLIIAFRSLSAPSLKSRHTPPRPVSTASESSAMPSRVSGSSHLSKLFPSFPWLVLLPFNWTGLLVVISFKEHLRNHPFMQHGDTWNDFSSFGGLHEVYIIIEAPVSIILPTLESALSRSPSWEV